jgi:hypothetical protein
VVARWVIIADCGLRIADLFRDCGLWNCGLIGGLIESAINPQPAILNPQYAFYFPGGCGVGV